MAIVKRALTKTTVPFVKGMSKSRARIYMTSEFRHQERNNEEKSVSGKSDVFFFKKRRWRRYPLRKLY